MIILFDWLSFTSKCDSPDSIIDLLGLQEVKWVPTYGGRGYHDRMMFNGISIYYNNGKVPGVWVEMSGTGCRTFEEFGHCDWSVIFGLCSQDDAYNITRLDVACDDKEGVLDIEQIRDDTAHENWVSKWHDARIEHTVKLGSCTVYFGSSKSTCMLRIYDKAKERLDNVGADDLGHWIRAELVLRDERALAFAELPYDQIGRNFVGVINNYLRFLQPVDGDSNRSRWPTSPWWLDFVQTLEKISLYTPCDTEYSLDKTKQYVYKQAGNAVDTIVQIIGEKQFLKELSENKPAMAAKYKQLIHQNQMQVVEAMGDLSDFQPIGTEDNTGIADFLRSKGEFI